MSPGPPSSRCGSQRGPPGEPGRKSCSDGPHERGSVAVLTVPFPFVSRNNREPSVTISSSWSSRGPRPCRRRMCVAGKVSSAFCGLPQVGVCPTRPTVSRNLLVGSGGPGAFGRAVCPTSGPSDPAQAVGKHNLTGSSIRKMYSAFLLSARAPSLSRPL